MPCASGIGSIKDRGIFTLSEALIQGTITTRPAFIDVFLEENKLYYRPVDSHETESVQLYEN